MKSDQFYSWMKQLGALLEQGLISITKAYLNTSLGQGTLAKLIGWLVPKLEEVTLKPLIQAAMVEAGYKFDVHQGRVLVEKIKEAREGGDEAGYDHSTDVILG